MHVVGQWFLPIVYRSKFVQRSGWTNLLGARLETRSSNQASAADVVFSSHIVISQSLFPEKLSGLTKWSIVVAWLWEGEVLRFGLLLHEFLKAISRWRVVLHQHRMKFTTEDYGGGFGQGISHKTVKVQLSNAQLSGTFLWEMCYLRDEVCGQKGLHSTSPKAVPISKGEGFSAALPIPADTCQ